MIDDGLHFYANKKVMQKWRLLDKAQQQVPNLLKQLLAGSEDYLKRM